MKSLLDPTFKYVPSTKTDLKKTFARIRREMAEAKKQEPTPPPTNVAPIKQKRKATA